MEPVFTKKYQVNNADELIIAINDHIKETFNVVNSTINIKLDKHFTKLLYLAKKCYVGVIGGNLNTKGLDYIKTSTLKYAATLQKDLLDKILFHNQFSFQAIFEKYKRDFYGIQWDDTNIDQITLMQRVTKHPSKYATKSTAAEVAMWAIENKLLFFPGQMQPIVVTGYVDGKMKGVHALSGLWRDCVDKDYIWNHQVLPKLSRLTEVLSPEFDWKQFDSSIVDQRNRKVDMYMRQLLDTTKTTHVIQKITNDPTLSTVQKQDLMKISQKSKVKSLW